MKKIVQKLSSTSPRPPKQPPPPPSSPPLQASDCITPNESHAHPSHLGEQQTTNTDDDDSSDLPEKMLPQLAQATDKNNTKGGDDDDDKHRHQALLRYLHLRAASLNDLNLNEQHQHQQQQQQQQQRQEEEDRNSVRKKLFAKPQISYGGVAGKHNNIADRRDSSAPSSNKRKRFSLTSGNFSHQFPSSNDGGARDGDPEHNGHPAGNGGGPSGPAVSDIIGSFGLFQLLVLLFSGLREGLVGYDALIMSIILQPESKFLCADNLPPNQIALNQQNNTSGSKISSIGDFNNLIKQENYYFRSNLSEIPSNDNNLATAAAPATSGFWNETAQCFRSLDGGRTPLRSAVDGRPLECRSWIFPNQTAELGPSLVAEWSLVCQYHWLIAFIESAYFFGLVTGNLTWGYYADRFGRRPAYLMAHTISLVFGSLAVFMPSIYLFAMCRFLAAFGSVGYNIVYSIQVELIGLKHRSFSTILNHMGWGLGVICIPLVDRLFDDYRPIIAVAPLLSLAMFPWAFWLPESSRWLMANGRFKEAREELVRAAKFNGKSITPKLEKKIWELEQKVRFDRMQQLSMQSSEPAKRSYTLIFTSPKLLRDTLILAYLAFVGHLFYYLQTINFAYVKNLSTEANFITSGAGEWVSVVVGAILLKFCTRKTCMSMFLAVMAASFAFQSLIESNLMPELDTVPIITTNNGLGTLSSLLLVFIALIVNQEVYPTVVRQTGTSITNTIGELGSTLAPLVIQLSRLMGAWEANVTYTLLCSLGILFTQFLTKTDDIELPDT